MFKRLLQIGLAACAALFGNACQSVDAAPPGPTGEPSHAPIVMRPALQKLVDTLAAMNRIESSHIGAGGTPSPVWAAWLAVEKEAKPEELRALGAHPSPVVRGYVAMSFARAPVVDIAFVEKALRDTTRVQSTEGCMRGESSVAALVADVILWSAKDQTSARTIRHDIKNDKTFPDEIRRMVN